MKIVFFSILILTAALAGWFIGKLDVGKEKYQPGVREASFRLLVESYSPSCSELNEEGIFPLITNDDVRLYLEVRSNEYKVVGIKEEHGHLPLYWWAGASRQGAMSQVCAKP